MRCAHNRYLRAITQSMFLSCLFARMKGQLVIGIPGMVYVEIGYTDYQ